MAPLKPPASWFDTPEPESPLPLTVTKEGRVFGHLALWDTCHTGLMSGSFAECITPPRSQTGYAHFHLAPLETQEEEDVMVGRIVYDTSHASVGAGLQAATSHYDKTGSVGAFVRARDGQHGIWLSGAARSDISPEGLRDVRANPPSGDWRLVRNNLELVAALSVPVPGFPIQLSLSASAGGIDALILPGISEDDLVQSRDRSYLRRRQTLTSAFG